MLHSILMNSIEIAAIFFTVYEGTKDLSRNVIQLEMGRILLAASVGETVSFIKEQRRNTM